MAVEVQTTVPVSSDGAVSLPETTEVASHSPEMGTPLEAMVRTPETVETASTSHVMSDGAVKCPVTTDWQVTRPLKG